MLNAIAFPKKYIVPSLDQALASISNFLTVIIIAKAITPEEFGVYMLIYTAIMMIAGVQSSLVTGPMRVLGVANDAEENRYLQCQLHIQLGLSFGMAVLFGLGVYMMNVIDVSIIIYSSLCIVFLQFYEFARVTYLTKFEYKTLLISDFLVHLPKLIILYVLYLNGRLNLENSFLVIFLMSALSVLVYFKGSINFNAGKSELINAIRANWSYGKWLLLETIAFLLSSRIYIYLIGFLVGLELAGVLGATQNLLNTTNVIVMGIMAFAIPVARRAIMNDRYAEWRKWLISISVLLLVTVISVLGSMSLFSNQLMVGLYGEFYGEYSYLIPVLSIAYAISAINSVLSGAFRTVEQPEKGAKAKLVSAIVTLLLAYPLLSGWGLSGAVLGLIGTQLIWLFVYCVYIFKGSLNESNIVISATKV